VRLLQFHRHPQLHQRALVALVVVRLMEVVVLGFLVVAVAEEVVA
jgi:hypothetical protein